MLTLISLPPEILITLPDYLEDFKDFLNVSTTCHTLRNALAKTRPNTVLRLAAKQSEVLFQPHPSLLVAATVRQVADKAVGNANATETLRSALRGGLNTLFELCVSVAGLTLEDVWRTGNFSSSNIDSIIDFSDIYPGHELVDKANPYESIYMRNRSDESPFVCEQAFYQMVIYNELFASSLYAYLQPEKHLPYFDHHVRLDYIRYCVPDPICWRSNSVPSWWPIEPIGPYISGDAKHIRNVVPRNQALLLDLFNKCPVWRNVWRYIRLDVGKDFPTSLGSDFNWSWRQQLWRSVVYFQGMKGLNFLHAKGNSKWREELKDLYECVRDLPEDSDHVSDLGECTHTSHVSCPLYRFPFMPQDIEFSKHSCGWPWAAAEDD